MAILIDEAVGHNAQNPAPIRYNAIQVLDPALTDGDALCVSVGTGRDHLHHVWDHLLYG